MRAMASHEVVLSAVVGLGVLGCGGEAFVEDGQGVFAERLSEAGQPGARVTLCHLPGGDEAKAHTIEVAASSVAAHLAHGDRLAPCGEVAGGEDGGGDDPGDFVCGLPLEPIDYPEVTCATGLEPLPYGDLDPSGDVTLPNADIIRVAASTHGGVFDLRLQLCAVPFPSTHTQHVGVCLDTDFDAGTGHGCGAGSGIEVAIGLDYFILWQTFDAYIAAGGASFDACSVVTFDTASNTLRLAIPTAALGAESFRFTVDSNFGGSFGANEFVPDDVDAYLDLSPEPLPDFEGISICDVRP